MPSLTPPSMTPEVPSALSPLVRRVVADNPSHMTGPGTNTYLVGVDEVAVIDPGPGVQAAHRRDHRRRRARPHPLDRAHAHASRPRARRDAAGEGDRRRDLGVQQARAVGARRPRARRRRHDRRHRVPARGAAHARATRRTTSASSSTRSGCCSPATRSSAGCSRWSRRRPAATWPRTWRRSTGCGGSGGCARSRPGTAR